MNLKMYEYIEKKKKKKNQFYSDRFHFSKYNMDMVLKCKLGHLVLMNFSKLNNLFSFNSIIVRQWSAYAIKGYRSRHWKTSLQEKIDVYFSHKCTLFDMLGTLAFMYIRFRVLFRPFSLAKIFKYKLPVQDRRKIQLIRSLVTKQVNESTRKWKCLEYRIMCVCDKSKCQIFPSKDSYFKVMTYIPRQSKHSTTER